MKRTVTGAVGSETTMQRKAGGEQQNVQRTGAQRVPTDSAPAAPGTASAGQHSLRLVKYVDKGIAKSAPSGGCWPAILCGRD
ncbi:MAG TPA: hypothetical protein VKE24_06380 [Candidatus Acidoferrales bacterium]|nr:hypothetical protein [Candidatus Acidoferrales bacterium]